MSSFVYVQNDMSGRVNTFLVDTGATISIFKENKLKNNKFINYNSKCGISGIEANLRYTLGSTHTHLLLNNHAVEHTFHIVENNFPIPADGIIGLDFISKYKGVVNYNEWKLTIYPENNAYGISIPIHDSHPENVLFLPARCEVIRRIKFYSDSEEFLVPNQELTKGVYVGRTIASKSCPFVRILNTNYENKTLTCTKLATEPLDNYLILGLQSPQSNHKEKVLEAVSKNCPPYILTSLTKLLYEFHDIFAIESDTITTNNFYKQKLRLSDNTPIYIRNHRLPHYQKPEINKQINDMLKNKIIEPATSEYNSPILLVPKKSHSNDKNKSWRFVVDYRCLNKKLLADKFPLPRIDVILDQLGRAKYFSCLDLLSGFHQIELDKKSRDMTAFSTDKGSFRFTRLPFGLKIAPNSFQRMMTLAFAGLSPDRAFIYMDDLIVIGCSEKHMLKNLREVFETCRKFNLKLNAYKCVFFKHEVTFLGHKCTDKGILPDDTKYDIIRNYPEPRDAESVKRFVSFCNYYRKFIPKFSEYSYYLTRLTKKNIPFVWSALCQKSFNYLKETLLKPPILQYPDFSKTFYITTDASKRACGAVLSQKYGNKQLPVAYASRTFTTGEQNKAVIEQELTAIHWALNYFKPYIYTVKFVVQTDHRPLTYLFSMKKPSSKLTRMRLDLEEFDFVIEYIKGKDNVGADALSRIDFQDLKQLNHTTSSIQRVVTRSMTSKFTKTSNRSEKECPRPIKDKLKIVEAINISEVMELPQAKFIFNHKINKLILIMGNNTLRSFNLDDCFNKGKINLDLILLKLEKEAISKSIKAIRLSLGDQVFNIISAQRFKMKASNILNKLQIVLTPKVKIINNNEEKLEILQRYHEDPVFGGHCGSKRLLEKLRRYYTWKNLAKDVSNYVKNCIKCQENKALTKPKEKLCLTPTPQKPFHIVQIDTIGPLLRSDKGNNYAVTIMCDLTKYLVCIPVLDKSAKTVAKAIFDHFVLIYGPMTQVITDRGSDYVNKVLTELFKLLRVSHHTSTSYHHRSVGTIERSHRTFNEYVRSYINNGKTDWDEWLNSFTYCYNTTPSTVHGYCPFELIFGKTPTNFDFLESETIEPLYNPDSYANEVKFRLQVAHQRAQKLLMKSKMYRKEKYDVHSRPQVIKAGDLVLLENSPRHKLDPLFEGPFTVKSVKEPNCTLRDEKNKEFVVHMDRIKTFNKLFYYRFMNERN